MKPKCVNANKRKWTKNLKTYNYHFRHKQQTITMKLLKNGKAILILYAPKEEDTNA